MGGVPLSQFGGSRSGAMSQAGGSRSGASPPDRASSVAGSAYAFEGLLSPELHGSPDRAMYPQMGSGATEVRKMANARVSDSMNRVIQANSRRPKSTSVLGLAGLGAEGLRLKQRCRSSLATEHEMVIPSPREGPSARLRKVRTACPPGIADSWNKPEFTASAAMWSSASLRGRVGGSDRHKDKNSFYAAMRDYKAGRLEKAIKTWESIRLQLMMKSADPKNVAKSMSIVCGYLGDAYHRLVGEYPKAVDFHLSSLNFGEEIRYQCGKDCAVSESHENAIAALPAIGQPQKPVSGT